MMRDIRNIVVATDFSELAEAAGARATELALLDGAAIHLLHALHVPLVAAPYRAALPEALRADVRHAALEKLEAARKSIESEGVAHVTTRIAESESPVDAIAEAVRATRADLVAMGTHGHRGLQRVFLGSVAKRALHALEVPVLAAKESLARAMDPIRRILVPVDFSPHSERAIEVARSLAARLSATVDVMHVFDEARAPGYLPELGAVSRRLEAEASERLDAMRERFDRRGVPVALDLRRGEPSSVIAKTAEEIRSELIVMGTRGAGGLAHVLLGSVAERTLCAAPCSVLCVKAERF